MRFSVTILLGLFLVFIAPALASLALWYLGDHPASWRNADWSSAALLPKADADGQAAVYVMAARTGGLKGAFAVHSWIVTKRAGDRAYTRYDKVGWGQPIRKNAYPADGRWYSNPPRVVRGVTGPAAEALVRQVEAAVAGYPFAHSGDYHIWPGPNSNSFVAHVVDKVPALGATMPPEATGRDYAPGWASLRWNPVSRDLHATLGGIVGFSAGATSGFEMHFLGLVAGIDFRRPALKVPAFGTVGLPTT